MDVITEKKELDIRTVFELIKLAPFCAEFTNIDPRKGLYHRMKGYNTGKKPADLTIEDRVKLAGGLKLFADQLNELYKREIKECHKQQKNQP